MSSRSVSDIQTRAEGESLYIRYRSDANVLSYLKNDPSYEFIGEVIFKINIVKAEKIKAKVYVNQDKSLSDLQTLIKHSFLLYFPRELLKYLEYLDSRKVDPAGMRSFVFTHIK